MRVHLIIISWVLAGFFSCQSDRTTEGPQITYAQEADFSDIDDVTFQLAEGFQLDLWAPGPLIHNAVAVTFDRNGMAYVTETNRRKSSDIDIRSHRDWMTGDLSLQTIEDTETFHKKKLDPALSDQNDWMEDLNKDGVRDWQDLEVETETIRRIWDSDNDGRADASQLFADGFNTMITGVAAGILHHNEEIFLTAAPNVYKLKDTDGDGRADQREVISTGYGIHIAYAGHDMSGLTMGPDGRIYWSIGDIGVNVVDKNGKRWAYPNEGAVMRANPDGSEFEVFAHGLRNPQELAFDAFGNLISVDNDGDHPGEHERYVHIIEGSDSGWRINWQFGKYDQPKEEYKVWMDEKLYIPHFEGQAAYLLPPLALAPDGPAGLAYNPGTALGIAWENFFFASYFKGSAAKSQTQAFKLEPKGASFQLVEEESIINGIASTGVNFGPDGALYINDWKDGYAKKPQGRIWKLDVSKESVHPLRAETRQILQAGMKDRTGEELSQLLAHADMRVRMEAQFELVNQGKWSLLFAVAEGNDNELARLHGIWGIGQLARKDQKKAAILLPLLMDPNENVRAQTAKVLGEARYAAALEGLLAQVRDSSARATFFAVEALGKLGNAQAFNPLIDLLEANGATDPHLRHAIMYALSKLDAGPQLADLAAHPATDVRIGAVVALRHMSSPKVAAFLRDMEVLVMTEAARAIHDDQSIPEALPALAAALDRIEIQEEAFVRRAINANLRLGDQDCAQRLVDFINNPKANPNMRADALWALGYWADPPVLDRVEGRYRKLPTRNSSEANDAIAPYIKSFLASKTDEVSATAAAVAGRLGFETIGTELFAMLKNERKTPAARKEALSALAAVESDQILPALQYALASKHLELRQEAQELMGHIDLPENTLVDMLKKVLDNGSIPEQQKALASLANKKDEGAEILLNNYMDRLINGNVPPELQLDILDAVEQSNFTAIKAKKKAYESTKNSDDPLALYRESLYGGDPKKGERTFYRNNSAQCIRCHQLNGMGGEVGPPIDGIASVLTPEQLLAALVDPSARLAPGYGTVMLEMKDGKKLTGILQAENEGTISVKISDGTTTNIPLDSIASRKNAPSGMLSMSEVLSKNEIRNLMAFLVTLE